MRFFANFSVADFSNTYLLGPDGPGGAVLIDPGIFDEGVLRMIEDHKLYVRAVLLTHAHEAHTRGIKTLMKIYEASVHCVDPTLMDVPALHLLREGTLELAGLIFTVLDTPGHSSDSVCFKIGNLLFTGDTLAAGSIGSTSSGYERALLLASIRGKLLELDEETFVFPGHGPPTKIGIEKKINPCLEDKI